MKNIFLFFILLIPIYSLSQGDKQNYITIDDIPDIVIKNARYPDFCKNSNITGRVYVEIYIDKNGKVTKVQLMPGQKVKENITGPAYFKDFQQHTKSGIMTHYDLCYEQLKIEALRATKTLEGYNFNVKEKTRVTVPVFFNLEEGYGTTEHSRGFSLSPNISFFNNNFMFGLDFSLKYLIQIDYDSSKYRFESFTFGFSTNMSENDKIQNFYFKPFTTIFNQEEDFRIGASVFGFGFYNVGQNISNMWYYRPSFNLEYKNFSLFYSPILFFNKNNRSYFDDRFIIGLKYHILIPGPKIFNLYHPWLE